MYAHANDWEISMTFNRVILIISKCEIGMKRNANAKKQMTITKMGNQELCAKQMIGDKRQLTNWQNNSNSKAGTINDINLTKTAILKFCLRSKHSF